MLALSQDSEDEATFNNLHARLKQNYTGGKVMPDATVFFRVYRAKETGGSPRSAIWHEHDKRAGQFLFGCNLRNTTSPFPANTSEFVIETKTVKEPQQMLCALTLHIKQRLLLSMILSCNESLGAADYATIENEARDYTKAVIAANASPNP